MRNRDRSPGNSRKDYEAPRGLDRRGGYSRRNRDRGGNRAERSFKDRVGRRDGRDSRDRGGRGERRERGPQRGQMSPEDASTVPGSEEERSLVERNYDRSIFVGNIPFETTAREVSEIFGNDFEVVRADVITRRGLSRGMATVEFNSVEDVEQAIAKFDRTQFANREIFVRQDYPPPEDRRDNIESSRSKAADEEDREPNPEVFVGNLPYTVSWQTLKDEFRSVGTIVRADVLTDRQGKSRGFGTVVYKTTEDAQAAIEKYKGFDFEGRKIDVRFARESKKAPQSSSGKKNSPFTDRVTGDGERSKTIFVGNLPYITTKADLFDLFETVGHVTRGEIQLDSRGRPSGNAVVEFELEDLADLAISNLNNYNYGGRPLQISFALFPNEESNDAEMAD